VTGVTSSNHAAGWETVPLVEAAFVGAGNSAPQKEELFKDGCHPFIRTSDVGQIGFGKIGEARDLLNEAGVAKLRRVPKGTILMPKSGASTFLNHRVETTVDAYVSSHLATIEARKNKALPRYLLYYLSTVKAQELIQDHRYPSLTLSVIGSVLVPLPHIEEQKRIVAVLDQAFADLDRVRAQSEANLADTGELLIETRERILDASQPGWTSEKLARLISIKHGFAFKSEFFASEGDHVLLTPGNFFERGGFRHRGGKQKFYEGEIPKGFVLNQGDLLMAMTEQAPGLLGSCILVPESNRFLHNQRLGLIQPMDSSGWHSPYFAHVFNTKAFRQKLSSTCTGIKVRHTSPDKIRAAEVPVPPSLEAQRRIAIRLNELTDDAERLKAAYCAKHAEVSLLRKLLLRKAFAGELS
jgi:type I restriction enzyme S subunit